MERLILATLLLSCGERPGTFAGLSSIPLLGRAVYADGRSAPAETIELSLLADGANLFPAGVNGCSPGDAHAQALQTLSVITALDGSFSVTAPITGFVRATDDTCAMAAEAAANLTRIELRAQTEADFGTCVPYCRKYRWNMCYGDCVGRGQKFIWTATLSPTDVGAHRTIKFESLGPPLPDASAPGPALPDLRVDAEAARSSLELTTEDFAADDCVLQDGCIAAPGTRTLLRFDGDIENLGAGDLQIGSPENNPLFTYSACHKHYHLEDIMTFELLDQMGQPVFGDNDRVIGSKQGFCIQGMERIAGKAPNIYDCDNQGLAAGWADVYGAGLSCQWLDVTGVPTGDYLLRITVNAGRQFPESDFDNNSEQIPVSIR